MRERSRIKLLYICSMKNHQIPIVSTPQFILATRDSGYRSTSFAIAELIDNSLEAGATLVELIAEEDNSGSVILTIKDNGKGMSPQVLECALQFGGSSRFNSRQGSGRYGMGLPNSSLSQARRVDVYSWQDKSTVWWSYLDIDEINSKKRISLPTPTVFKRRLNEVISDSGTIVKWSKCDKLDHKRFSLLISRLTYDLGRIFRFNLWGGKTLLLNGKKIAPQDPLFLKEHCGIIGAIPFGTSLSYKVAIPMDNFEKKDSVIEVRFSEISVETLHNLSNEEKNAVGIAKGAGVSVVRNGREISTGWLFMGSKRKENYDDWWRCEIHFEPHLDELFGITHNKQVIRPTQSLVDILSPDMERIAKILNNRVRQKFIDLKKNDGITTSKSTTIANVNETMLDPVRIGHSKEKKLLNKLAYNFRILPTDNRSFFTPLLTERKLTVILNSDHPFFESIYSPLLQLDTHESKLFRQHLEILLLASARSELSLNDQRTKDVSLSIREKWSDILAAFLG